MAKEAYREFFIVCQEAARKLLQPFTKSDLMNALRKNHASLIDDPIKSRDKVSAWLTNQVNRGRMFRASNGRPLKFSFNKKDAVNSAVRSMKASNASVDFLVIKIPRDVESMVIAIDGVHYEIKKIQSP